MSQNPLLNWKVDRSAIRFVGQALQRPECIIAQRDGTLWSADARGGVMRISLDGSQQLLSPKQDHKGEEVSFEQRFIQSQNASLPNGLALTPEGDFIICNWGLDRIERLRANGELVVLHDNLHGKPLGKTNFPLLDSKGRIWFTVTTQMQPWTDSINAEEADGYIGVIDDEGIRTVATGVSGANEIRFDEDERWLYVVESNARRISRFQVGPDATLSHREVYGPETLEGFPDGFAFDSFGNLWVTLIMTDKLIAITPEGEVLTLLDDSNPEATARLYRERDARALTPQTMQATRGELAPWMASITFGGPDLKTVYLGSLLGNRIPCFQSPVAGQALIHW